MTKTVVIDPGHGGWDQGSTPCDMGRGGVMEAVHNWRVSKALGDYLTENYQVNVVYTHEGPNTSLDAGNLARELSARSWVANRIKADLLVSNHHNAGGSPQTNGGELYVWTSKLNRQGGLLWLPSSDGRPEQNHTDPKSYPVAAKVLPHLKEALSRFGVGWRSYGDPAGIACANFGILRNTQGPAILIETHYATNENDAAAARRPDWAPTLARFIGDGIAEALALPRKGIPVETPIGVLLGQWKGETICVDIAGQSVPVRAIVETLYGKSTPDGKPRVEFIPPEKGGPRVAVR